MGTKDGKHPKKSSEYRSGRLENYSSNTRKLPNRLQAVLKNTSNHTKYWLSSLLKLDKLFFSISYVCLIYISPHFMFPFVSLRQMWTRLTNDFLYNTVWKLSRLLMAYRRYSAYSQYDVCCILNRKEYSATFPVSNFHNLLCSGYIIR